MAESCSLTRFALYACLLGLVVLSLFEARNKPRAGCTDTKVKSLASFMNEDIAVPTRRRQRQC